MTQVDVVIVGGGMAGLALASALAGSGLRIEVLEKQLPLGPDTWSDGFDPRVSAITRASENILRFCGAWDFIESQRIAPYADMDVWDGEGTGNIQFHASEASVEYLGHIIENRVIQYGLYLACQAHENITINAQGMDQLSRENGTWLVTLEDKTQLLPTLLVGADGGHSTIRERTGFSVREWDYGHNGVVTTVETEKPHGNVARQPFLATGPLGVLPLRQKLSNEESHLSSIVWSADTKTAAELMTMDEATFNHALTVALEGRLGKVVRSERRFSFPLQQRHATDYISDNVALVADAAHTLHPLAGQGINMGFLDAAVLAEEVSNSVRRGLSPIEPMGLKRYQRRRKGHNLMMMSTMEGFKRLFDVAPMPLRLLRNQGMSLLNEHPIAKGHILKHAMGFAGDLPEAAQSA